MSLSSLKKASQNWGKFAAHILRTIGGITYINIGYIGLRVLYWTIKSRIWDYLAGEEVFFHLGSWYYISFPGIKDGKVGSLKFRPTFLRRDQNDWLPLEQESTLFQTGLLNAFLGAETICEQRYLSGRWKAVCFWIKDYSTICYDFESSQVWLSQILWRTTAFDIEVWVFL